MDVTPVLSCNVTVDEECWEDVAVTLLAAALRLNGSCHTDVTLTPSVVEASRQELTSAIIVNGHMDVDRLQEYLEHLNMIGIIFILYGNTHVVS